MDGTRNLTDPPLSVRFARSLVRAELALAAGGETLRLARSA